MAFEPFTKEERPTMENFNKKFACLNIDIGERAKIQTGSYEGTGTYGADNPCSITFNFAPELVIVFIVNTSTASTTVGFPTFFRREVGVSKTWVLGYPGGGNAIAKWDGNTLSWYVPSARGWNYSQQSVLWTDVTAQRLQLNDLGTTYSYIAIG